MAPVPKYDFFNLYLARKCCPFLLTEDLATMIQAFVTTRLNYCYSLYLQLNVKTMHWPQLVLELAVCLLHGINCHEHSGPVLKSVP